MKPGQIPPEVLNDPEYQKAMKNKKMKIMMILWGASAAMVLIVALLIFVPDWSGSKSKAKNKTKTTAVAKKKVAKTKSAVPKRESTGDAAYDAFLAEYDQEFEFIYRKDDANKSYEERINQLDEQIRRSRNLLDKHMEQSETREYKALEKRNSSLLGQRAMF